MKSKTERKKLFRFIRLISLGIVLLMLSVLLLFAASILRLDAWHEFDASKILNCDRSLIVYDKDGNEVSVLKMSENRIYISIDSIPEAVRNAFIAAEDVRFYKHPGFDIKRIIGAAIADIKAGSYEQGASTISQQLIKLSHLSSEKTFKRKIEEAILAYQMERQFEKDEILEMYLNYCYFGGGFYGIEAASRGYFGKSASEITAAQGAMLAGILKSPSRYAPHINLEASIKRRNLILKLMKDYGFLEEGEYEKAVNEEAIITKTNFADQRGYYIDTALLEACEHLNITLDELLTGGYHVYTSMDSAVQKKCEEIFADGSFFINDEIQAAIAVVNPETGMVSAMVGGRNSNVAMAYNRATQIRRQPGSIIKPIICYAPAMEYYGYTAATMIPNMERSFAGYSPKNFDGRYSSQVSLRKAISSSLNIPAVEVLNDISVRAGMKFASNVGIEFADNDKSLALALGGFAYGVSPLQIASAYAMFADDGYYCKPQMVEKILDSNGKVLYSYNIVKSRVISKENAFILSNILCDVVTKGTGRRLGEVSNKGIELAGKTGTSNEVTGAGGTENRDAWMVAYNTEYSAAVWMGYDSAAGGKSLPHDFTGGSYPAEILKALFLSIYENRPAPKFIRPKNVIEIRLDAYTMEKDSVPALATPITPEESVLIEYFIEGTQPDVQSKYWVKPKAPENFSCRLNFYGNPIITFTGVDSDVVYRVYREDSSGLNTLIYEYEGAGYAYFEDEYCEDPYNSCYYCIPMHKTLKVNGEALCGDATKKVRPYE